MRESAAFLHIYFFLNWSLCKKSLALFQFIMSFYKWRNRLMKMKWIPKDHHSWNSYFLIIFYALLSISVASLRGKEFINDHFITFQSPQFHMYLACFPLGGDVLEKGSNNLISLIVSLSPFFVHSMSFTRCFSHLQRQYLILEKICEFRRWIKKCG